MFNRITAALVASPIALSTAVGSALASDDGLTSIEELGKKIFFDENLSIRQNQACASCHVPAFGWTGPDSEINEHGAVYEGSLSGLFGNRKPPSSAYATESPVFYADFSNPDEPLFVGGNFWDGRATGERLGNPAADQARGPFVNPVEQALPDAACVVYRVCENPGQGQGPGPGPGQGPGPGKGPGPGQAPISGQYADLFKQVWGTNVCAIDWPANVTGECALSDGQVELTLEDREKVETAYDQVALSVAAFEASKESNAFTSKFDAQLAGLYEFTEQEELGREIFNGRGKCSACHVASASAESTPPLFTDFTYDNLGVPRNPENPFLVSNPDWQDPGLGGFLATRPDFVEYADANLGKHKVPTLRNVGLGSCEALEYGAVSTGPCITKAYTHNGYFKSLLSLVHFYNTRDVLDECPDPLTTEADALAQGCWPAPEVAENVNTDELGDLGLTEEEEFALVAFMMTMSDGYLDGQ